MTTRYFVLILAAMLVLNLSGCSRRMSMTEKGALSGAAIGSGLGAVVGHQHGRAGEGTAIGGAAGAVTGGLIGAGMEDDEDDDY